MMFQYLIHFQIEDEFPTVFNSNLVGNEIFKSIYISLYFEIISKVTWIIRKNN